jgi:hypothetical protein
MFWFIMTKRKSGLFQQLTGKGVISEFGHKKKRGCCVFCRTISKKILFSSGYFFKTGNLKDAFLYHVVI